MRFVGQQEPKSWPGSWGRRNGLEGGTMKARFLGESMLEMDRFLEAFRRRNPDAYPVLKEGEERND